MMKNSSSFLRKRFGVLTISFAAACIYSAYKYAPEEEIEIEEAEKGGKLLLAKKKKTILSPAEIAKRLNWLHVGLLLGTPMMALWGSLNVPLQRKTLVWAIIYYFCTGLGITMGYHRYFAHRAYDCALPVRLALALFGAGAVEGSILWWSRDHRSHHRYTDTEQDPYNAQNGFFYSHMGWMLVKQNTKKIGRSDISDLKASKLVRWQHQYYLPIAFTMSFIFPSVVAGLGWGDYKGGLFYAGIARLVFVHHATFCVNSLAHYLGDFTYADKHTPRDSIVTAFMTLGEGYHNFHHEFPMDYRNGIRWYQYDPTKAMIYTLSLFGLTYNLHQFPANEIEKGSLQMKEKKILKKLHKLSWGPDVKSLPVLTWNDIKRETEDKQRILVVIDGLVHDASKFVQLHPGGQALLRSYNGKDITHEFNGDYYDHSNAAHNLLHNMRVGRLNSEDGKGYWPLSAASSPLSSTLTTLSSSQITA